MNSSFRLSWGHRLLNDEAGASPEAARRPGRGRFGLARAASGATRPGEIEFGRLVMSAGSGSAIASSPSGGVGEMLPGGRWTSAPRSNPGAIVKEFTVWRRRMPMRATTAAMRSVCRRPREGVASWDFASASCGAGTSDARAAANVARI